MARATGHSIRRIGLHMLALLFLLGPLVLAYARFIEPRILTLKETGIALAGCFAESGAARIAAFSDIHVSPYRYFISPERIAKRVNAARPDLVFIAGDFVSHLPPAEFDAAFAPFAEIEAPVYAVLGNHDLGLPGPDVRAPLGASLTGLGVEMMDDRAVDLSTDKFDFELVGMSDLWAKGQKIELFDAALEKPRLALTHNPETMEVIEVLNRPDLMIAGHTHGGQIYIPFITCRYTFACRIVREGYREWDGGAVFVTPGTGQSMAPLRFAVPPRIDVLNVTWRQCDGTDDRAG